MSIADKTNIIEFRRVIKVFCRIIRLRKMNYLKIAGYDFVSNGRSILVRVSGKIAFVFTNEGEDGILVAGGMNRVLLIAK